ncbi:O-acetyl-ADP-ribose deacetylase [Pseudogracilibacillus sp. SE30717A]|uniref:O-acetyl-ADP-ribose deacetylase n=1 Tax=Pseudogracilibacillus sp. SE30717A TaxID=3098293 RepID=UPI00300DEC88
MLMHINNNTLEISIGDITKQFKDVIVNAANGSLSGGGGVDGAIHRAAGPKLMKACQTIRNKDLNGEHLKTGEVVITKGYNLPAKFIIHTVGPIWDPNLKELQQKQLANCYWNALSLAKSLQLKSIAFPSISTGAYGFPIELASSIALKTITDFLNQNNFGKVIITLFSKEDLRVYTNKITSLKN